MATRIEAVEGGTEAEDILLKDFTYDDRPGYVRIYPQGNAAKFSGKGYLMPIRYGEFAPSFREMEVRSDDVWVASYPKSGTTWSQEMVWCISNDLDFDRAKSVMLRLRFPFVENSCMSKFHGKPGEENTPSYKYGFNSVKYISDLPSPRFIKTHISWDLLPEQVKSKKPKIVCVARNPKDTCVSYFHHCSLLEGFRGSLSDFVTLFLEDTVAFSPYWDNLLSYWEHKDDSNVLFLTYEEMKKDLPSVVGKVCKFLDKKMPSDEDLKALCNHLSFDSMKANDAVNYECLVEKKRSSTDQHFMRKGKVNAWKEEMSPEDVKRFDDWIEKNLNKLDSETKVFFQNWFIDD
ncbi:luciferin sulfotransferase-like [Ischnura elegans]|uniref:luciferin sulfotransferase-like n=1 Tax=Ischnura elegans TaxID=197161 RepID=UPI001ED87BF7|nr:luciferin sulfotransferase-like [Ischnura elegans]